MAIKIGQEFERTSKATRFKDDVMTKAQMLAGTDDNYSDGYLVVEKDSHDLYIYDSNATPSAETGKFVKKGPEGSSLPAGGTTGQILAKNSDDDGDAGWIVDTGKDLNKLVEWGSHTSQSPRTEYVPEITDSTVDPYHRVILHIPIQGSALQDIEATEESLKNCLKTRFKIRYNTELSGTVVFTTTTEDTAGDGSNSFGMKTNLTSSYADSRLYIYLNETTISDNTLHLAVNYYVKFAASQTNHNGKPQNVVLVANDGYTFGVTPVGEPYYVHNSTKIALDDLKINNFNIPTSWGVAKTGNLKMYMTNKQSYQYLWFGNLGFSSVDDYVIFVDITGGMEAAWGKPTVIVSNKSATEAGISLECDSAEATWFNVNYVIIGKGYGNITSGGGSGTISNGFGLTLDNNEISLTKCAVESVISNGYTKFYDKNSQGALFKPSENGMRYVYGDMGAETGEEIELASKQYVDSKSPTIVNEGATFTNAAGNQKMQIRTGGADSVIIKDTSGDGTTEYWTHEIPNKSYVDNAVSTAGNTFLIIKDTTTYQEILNAFNAKKGLLFCNSAVVDGTSYPAVYALKQTDHILLYVHNHPQIIDVWKVNTDNTYEKTREFVLAENQAIKDYVDGKVGDLTTLTTADKTNTVSAINEVKSAVDSLGEPFRVKQWGSNSLNVTIPCCTSDISNGNIDKMVFSIDAVEGADYQIVGMVAYEVFDAASGGSRINCWPVCQFTGNGQKELSVRWMCGGTTDKVAKRINAWVLLKHR